MKASEICGYIRFGELPEGGHSFNNLDGRFEDGISVYPARKTGPSRYVIEATSAGQVAGLRALFAPVLERPVYFLTGRQVGRGSDGEPLLSEAGIVSEEVPADADVSCWGYYLLGIRRWSERRRAASSEARPERIRVDPARLPDPARLVEEVLSRGAGSRSMIHGPAHWRHVAYFGWCVLAGEPRVDPLVVFLFSLFHDAMRESDGHDPEHGRRGSKLARDLHGKAHFITDSQMRLLDTACAGHADGYTSADPTIGACWDADRLTLWRVGRKPNPALLSTERGRGPAIINAAKHIQHGTPPGWQTLFRLYGLIDSKEPAPLPEGPIVPEHLHSFWGQVEHGKREMLKRWGLLEEYDRMQAEPGRTLAKSAPPSTSSLMDLAQKPWKETPWK